MKELLQCYNRDKRILIQVICAAIPEVARAPQQSEIDAVERETKRKRKTGEKEKGEKEGLAEKEKEEEEDKEKTKEEGETGKEESVFFALADSFGIPPTLPASELASESAFFGGVFDSIHKRGYVERPSERLKRREKVLDNRALALNQHALKLDE
uniref:Uncharacterized protein n=1 Tax=Chromera velia CCMP2878 TaxID=1169474 RepID=A0A0G4FSI3_9ALVE|eukprot:Cvel_18534.t1-p1 / transcript=Cvel_18534.t1 / gene=Cvel_18534 / organism=Chromera_velia_CCMP2878 / gene_product=hypothetical protein / transcript_product=hypothetical protein / location=Cvel_scaffold1541:39768-40229(-) / protein_length=154 / sequence_SO=supercontig / SO=protein_coding / is_pseudo=false